jgi:hypothetical protein
MGTILNHLDNVVRPAVRAYVAAEDALDAAHASKDQAAIDAARIDVLRLARTAAIELHHLQDVILTNTKPRFARIEDVRDVARAGCFFGRSNTAVNDTDLLRDTADALKHYEMNRKNSTVAGAEDVLSLSNGYGEMRYGEQKHGGKEQVSIRTKNGNKYSLLWVIHNSYCLHEGAGAAGSSARPIRMI